MTYRAAQISRYFQELERRPTAEEDIATRLLHACLIAIPTFGAALSGVTEAVRWRRGGNHEGDLVAVIDGTAVKHIEVKSRGAQINFSKRACFRSGCPGPQWQLSHMAEDRERILLIAPAGARSHRDLDYVDEATRALVDHLTWVDVADILESAAEGAGSADATFDPLPLMLGLGFAEDWASQKNGPLHRLLYLARLVPCNALLGAPTQPEKSSSSLVISKTLGGAAELSGPAPLPESRAAQNGGWVARRNLN